MPEVSMLRSAATLLQTWRRELFDSHVNCSTGQVDDVDAARDIAEIDRVMAALASAPPEATRPLMPLMRTGLFISFDVLDEKQAQRNHGQTLARLAERGGLGPDEALAIAEKREWRSRDIAGAVAALSALAAAAPPPVEPAGTPDVGAMREALRATEAHLHKFIEAIEYGGGAASSSSALLEVVRAALTHAPSEGS